MRGASPLLALVCLAAAPMGAGAATVCAASATPLAFGAVAGNAAVDVDGTVTVGCQTLGVALLSTVRVRMCLNIGAGSGGPGQLTPRRMTSVAGDPLQFQIYRDPARVQIWGDNAASTAPTPRNVDFEYLVLLLGATYSTTVSMHGRVPAQPALAAGSYSSQFAGADTRLDYRYSEPVLGVVNYPASCTSGGSGGGSVTFPFAVSAPVPNRCTVTSVTPLAFGTVPGRVAAGVDQAATLQFNCTGRTAWTVGLDNGTHASGTTRRMRLGTAGTSYVTYELYNDPARTQRWGATAGTGGMTGTGTGLNQSLQIYGRVPGNQTVPAGTYQDTIQVTITY